MVEARLVLNGVCEFGLRCTQKINFFILKKGGLRQVALLIVSAQAAVVTISFLNAVKNYRLFAFPPAAVITISYKNPPAKPIAKRLNVSLKPAMVLQGNFFSDNKFMGRFTQSLQ